MIWCNLSSYLQATCGAQANLRKINSSVEEAPVPRGYSNSKENCWITYNIQAWSQWTNMSIYIISLSTWHISPTEPEILDEVVLYHMWGYDKICMRREEGADVLIVTDMLLKEFESIET